MIMLLIIVIINNSSLLKSTQYTSNTKIFVYIILESLICAIASVFGILYIEVKIH